MSVNNVSKKPSCLTQFFYALCNLFTYIICIFLNPINARYLWHKFKSNFYHPQLHTLNGKQEALQRINTVLALHGNCLSHFDLPLIITNMRDINTELVVNTDNTQLTMKNYIKDVQAVQSVSKVTIRKSTFFKISK